MKALLFDWSWLVCLLVAVELPTLFLTKRPPSLDRERLIRDVSGSVWLAILVLLLALWIFAGWKVALFVFLADMLALAIDEVLAFPFWFVLKAANHPTYSLAIGPAIWGLASSVLIGLKFLHQD